MKAFTRHPLDRVLDMLCAIPDWVPRGLIVLVLGLAAWLPVGVAWLILSAIGGLR